MLNPTTPTEVLTARARGLLLGLVRSAALGGNRQGEWPTEATLVIPVAEAILATGRPRPDEMLRRWVTTPRGDLVYTLTDQVLALVAAGHPLETAAATAVRLCSRPDLGPPLLRTIPVSVACLGQGFRLRRWVSSLAGATHRDQVAQMAAYATARLGQDLLSRGLEESLARTAQALREDAPESLISALTPLGHGEAVRGGEDARGVLQATIQALYESHTWEEAVEAASARGIDGDQAVILTGAFAGALWGVGDTSEAVAAAAEARVLQLAGDLVSFGRLHAADPLPAVGSSLWTEG